MTTVHLSGFGWLGSVLALHLDRRGIPFTWSDPDARRTAWRSSNGVVYPDGDADAQRDAAVWKIWERDGLLPSGTVAPALFAYSQKHPPHSGKYKPIRLWGDVHSSPPGLAYVVNVPDAVRATRERFAALRLDSAPADALVVESHGYGRRLDALEWGWTATARLHLPAPAQRALDEVGGLQLYGRVHRWELAYATSVPGRHGTFRVGTSRIRARGFKPDAAAEHFAQRAQSLADLFPGVRVLDADAPEEGWRPVPRRGDDLMTRRIGGVLALPSASHSGVRRAPTIIASALRAIERAM